MASDLAALAGPLAEESAKAWLRDRGAPPEDLGPAVVGRLLAMARDAAGPPRRQFPGGLMVRRRGGRVWAERE